MAEKFTKKLDEMRNRAVQMEQDFEQGVQTHPLRSVGLAFGVGALTGLATAALLRRI